MEEKNVVKKFYVGGRNCEVVLENVKEVGSDYYRYALYDNNKRKFGVRKLRCGTLDEGFVNSMILKYKMENNELC